MKHSLISSILTAVLALRLAASPPAELESVNAETLRPFTGSSVRLADTGTLTGKVMCGYQGWFSAAGDGADRGFHHWSKDGGPLQPGNAKIDLWPDVSELGPEERFPNGLRHADGSMAEVFSSFSQATVLRHLQWMRDYGIDGAFVQRFIEPLRDARNLRHKSIGRASNRHSPIFCRKTSPSTEGKPYGNPSPAIGMSQPEIRAALDSSVVMRLLTGQPLDLAMVARHYMADLASAKPGFLDRLIHAEAATARLPLITFEKAAARLAYTRLLKAAP